MMQKINLDDKPIRLHENVYRFKRDVTVRYIFLREIWYVEFTKRNRKTTQIFNLRHSYITTSVNVFPVHTEEEGSTRLTLAVI